MKGTITEELHLLFATCLYADRTSVHDRFISLSGRVKIQFINLYLLTVIHCRKTNTSEIYSDIIIHSLRKIALLIVHRIKSVITFLTQLYFSYQTENRRRKTRCNTAWGMVTVMTP